VSDDLDATGNPVHEVPADRKVGDGKERGVGGEFPYSVPCGSVGHIYDEPGQYAISFVVRSADGQEVIVDRNSGEPRRAGLMELGRRLSQRRGWERLQYTWSVKLTPPSDAAEEDWDVDIYFHDCPDGGRHFSGFERPLAPR
jgi:hypothetical protein